MVGEREKVSFLTFTQHGLHEVESRGAGACDVYDLQTRRSSGSYHSRRLMNDI